MRVFPELTPCCESTTLYYAAGDEAKEIAKKKCRAVSTIKNQLQTAFLTLGVKNRSELTMKLAERVTGVNIKRAIGAIVCAILICVDSLSSSSNTLFVRTYYRRAYRKEITI